MNIFCIIIELITSLSIIITSILKPSITIKNKTINLYWVIALFGALIILISGAISLKELFQNLTSNSSINPLKILILFISMTLISIFLDEIGIFSFLAAYIFNHTKNSQYKIFIILYISISILTMFTSNDIIILTFTPLIIQFCKNAKVSPIPYLVMEFSAANTWSMMFVVGNPTNIYLAETFNVDFISYFLKMAIPTLICGLIEFLLLLLIFQRKLKQHIQHEIIPLGKLNPFLSIYGVSTLGITTIFLVISSYIKLEMYLISLFSAAILLVGALTYLLIKRNKIDLVINTIKRGPYELIPFILSMFCIVLALSKYGVTKNIADLLGGSFISFRYAFSSLLMSNFLNNIPMTLLYSSIETNLTTSQLKTALYSSVLGSNIGAFLTPVGALAGIMFTSIIKKYDVKYSFFDFMKYGICIGVPIACVGAFIIMVI